MGQSACWPSSKKPYVQATTARHLCAGCSYQSLTALRGRWAYPRLRTGNAGTKFVSLDNYVWWRLLRLMVKKRGRNLHAGQADRWDSAWFHDQGLYKLMGTIRYPKAA